MQNMKALTLFCFLLLAITSLEYSDDDALDSWDTQKLPDNDFEPKYAADKDVDDFEANLGSDQDVNEFEEEVKDVLLKQDNPFSPEALVAVKRLLENAEEAEYHRKPHDDEQAKLERRVKQPSRTTTTEPALKPRDGRGDGSEKGDCPPGHVMKDGKCQSGKGSYCLPGEKFVCKDDNPRDCQCQPDSMKGGEADKPSDPASSDSDCPPGHTNRDGKCEPGHAKCKDGEKLICDKLNPRDCKCQVAPQSDDESDCPPGHTMRDGKCQTGKGIHLKCPEGEEMTCEAGNPRDCKCQPVEKPEPPLVEEAKEENSETDCPPGHTMRDGKCQTGKGIHLQCPEGEEMKCDLQSPRDCKCEPPELPPTTTSVPDDTSLDEDSCPPHQTFRDGKCISAKITHLQECPEGQVVMCRHHNPRSCECVDDSSQKKSKTCDEGMKKLCEGDECVCQPIAPVVECGQGTKKICADQDGDVPNCVCEILEVSTTAKPTTTTTTITTITSPPPIVETKIIVIHETSQPPEPPVWTMFHHVHTNFPPNGWATPQDLQCRRRICKSAHGENGMSMICRCKLSDRKKPLTCKPQYRKVCKGNKCGCFHKCDLRNIMRRCDCEAEQERGKIADPGTSLLQFCETTRRDFCQRQCRPCTELECQYANTPMKKAKSNIGVFIAAQFRQEHCRKHGCSDSVEHEDQALGGNTLL